MLRGRIRELAAARVRYGYFSIYILLRREGWKINHKRVYRVYRLEGLSMRLKRPRRHVMAAQRQKRPAAGAINENWSMDSSPMPSSTDVASVRIVNGVPVYEHQRYTVATLGEVLHS